MTALFNHRNNNNGGDSHAINTMPYRYFHSLYTGATAHSGAYFGEGSGLVHLSFVKCVGFEYDVIECETWNVGISSTHSFDVGVKCQPGILSLIRCFVFQCGYHSSYNIIFLQLMKLTGREIFV